MTDTDPCRDYSFSPIYIYNVLPNLLSPHIVVCPQLELLVNGSIEYSPDVTAPYLEGTNAEHICVPGLVVIGNVIRVCQSDSTFSGVPPTCQRTSLK